MQHRRENNILYHYFREKFILPVRMWFYYYTRRLLIIFILAMVANLVFSYFFYTPKMYALRKENNDLVDNYGMLSQKIEQATAELAEIRNRDRNVYRSVFAIDTFTMEGIWQPYPDSKYAHARYGRFAQLMSGNAAQLDALGRQLYAQSLSFDQIELLAMDKDMMAECIPAIFPIDQRRMTNRMGAFGGRYHPVKGYYHLHTGVDIPARQGTPIYATATGTVREADWGSGYGKQVLIDHGFGYRTRYAHLSKISVRPGQVVKRGEIIGEMGATGVTTGTHLHYEVFFRGKHVNPVSYFSRDMSSEEYRNIIANARETTYE